MDGTHRRSADGASSGAHRHMTLPSIPLARGAAMEFELTAVVFVVGES